MGSDAKSTLDRTPTSSSGSGSARAALPPSPRATSTIHDFDVDFGGPVQSGTQFKGAEVSFTTIRPLNKDDPSEGYVVRALGGGYSTLKFGRKPSGLENEIAVLAVVEARRLLDSRSALVVHFPRLVDHWRLPDGHLFAAIGLLGPSLSDLRVLFGALSRSVAIRLALQAFEALRHLHQLGFVHGDVRPAVFAVGMRPREMIVFFKDLTRARQISDSNKQSGRRSGFFGAVRFVSRSVAVGELPQPRDDVESWLFVAHELCAPESLPWHRIADRRLVQRAKEEFFERQELSNPRLPHEFSRLTPLIANFQGHQDYDHIGLIFIQMMKGLRVQMDDPYVWQKNSEVMKSALFNAHARQKKDGEAGAPQTITEEATSSEESTSNDSGKQPKEEVVQRSAEKMAEELEKLVASTPPQLPSPPRQPPKKTLQKPPTPSKSSTEVKKRPPTRPPSKRASVRVKTTASRTIASSNSNTSDVSQEDRQKAPNGNKKAEQKKAATSANKATAGRQKSKKGAKKPEQPPSSGSLESISGKTDSKEAPPPLQTSGSRSKTVSIVAVPAPVHTRPPTRPISRPVPNLYFPRALTETSLSSQHSPTSNSSSRRPRPSSSNAQYKAKTDGHRATKE